MMILGIGTDLVDIDRIRKIIAGPQALKFTQKILTTAEFEIAEQRKMQHPARLEQYLAGRFAAKEAVAKALGCGFGEKLAFHHIEILHDNEGRPQCTLAEQTRRQLGLSDRVHIHVSISHTAEYANAFAVVAEGAS